jgi:hypothetical protein
MSTNSPSINSLIRVAEEKLGILDKLINKFARQHNKKEYLLLNTLYLTNPLNESNEELTFRINEANGILSIIKGIIDNIIKKYKEASNKIEKIKKEQGNEKSKQEIIKKGIEFEQTFNSYILSISFQFNQLNTKINSIKAFIKHEDAFSKKTSNRMRMSNQTSFRMTNHPPCVVS